MEKISKPNLYVIAGPNGAGKTTFAKEFLPHYAGCLEFVNADLIAGGISPFVPERAAIRAGRLMLQQIHSLGKLGRAFGFETTLAGRSYLPFLSELKNRGYCIHMFFLWVHSIDIALERIADRVRRGGHSVPETVVRRRFTKGLRNFFQLYRPLLDSWVLFDNSTDTPYMIAFEESGEMEIIDRHLFANLSKKVGGP